MQRVMIIGNCGAGKTHLSLALAQKTGLPVVHLDKLKWHGDWQALSSEEFDLILEEELKKSRWIIDGNYNRTIEWRMKYADTVIYLDFSTLACLYGVTMRVLSNYGKTRPDMGGNCPERFDMEFMRFVWEYRKKRRKPVLEMLAHAEDKQVIILKNRREVNRFLKSLPLEGKVSAYVDG